MATRADPAGGFAVFSKDGPGDAAGSRAHPWAQGAGALPKGWLAQGLVVPASEEEQGEGPHPAPHSWPPDATGPSSGTQADPTLTEPV